MAGRVAAIWACLGLAARCAVALAEGEPFGDAIMPALGHYVAWGIAGFGAGWLAERLVEDALAKRHPRPAETETEAAATAPGE